MNLWKRFVGVTLLFSLGFLTGATISNTLDADTIEADQARSRKCGPTPLSKSFYNSLNLSEAQRLVVDDVIENRRDDTGGLRKDMGRQMHIILDKAEEEITPLLDEGQQAAYRVLLDQWSEEHRRSVERRKERRESKWD